LGGPMIWLRAKTGLDLAGHFCAYREEERVAEQLRFLLSVH